MEQTPRAKRNLEALVRESPYGGLEEISRPTIGERTEGRIGGYQNEPGSCSRRASRSQSSAASSSPRARCRSARDVLGTHSVFERSVHPARISLARSVSPATA